MSAASDRMRDDGRDFGPVLDRWSLCSARVEDDVFNGHAVLPLLVDRAKDLRRFAGEVWSEDIFTEKRWAGEN